MKAKEPKDSSEKSLMKKENWKLAEAIDCNWHEEDCTCDICHQRITGRHMIDGIRSNFFEFALMCPKCHKNYGDGFGEGKGQLYTKLTNGSWLLTYGFTESQKMEADEDYEF
jgi:hypothetical protein